FPDPDLPPLVLTEEFIAEQQTLLPELPAKKRERFVEKYALNVTDAAVLTADRNVADYYEAVVHAGADAKIAANWVMTEVLGGAVPSATRRRSGCSPRSLSGAASLATWRRHLGSCR